MYKCTECGLEFEIKPDYCDCGNDEFVLTVENTSTEESAPVIKNEPAEQNARESLEKALAKDTTENKHNLPKTEPYRLPVSPFAMIIFILCLIFSFLIIFVWNPVTESAEDKTETQEVAPPKSIPSIEKLWKTTVPVVAEPIKQEPVIQPIVKKVENTVKNVTKNTPKATTKTKNTTKTAATTQAKTKVNNSVQQAQEAAQKAEQERLAKEAAAKKAAEDAKKKAEAEALAAAENARKNARAKQVLAGYKINLRNTIGQKIDFTRVIGDGDCAVTFKVDSTGRLTNRAFAKQSTNITLNNAVYNAVMAVPSYSAPPAAYKNETLTLNIRFQNGNFAITLE